MLRSADASSTSVLLSITCPTDAVAVWTSGGRNTTVAPRKLASSGPLLTTDVRGCASWTSLQPRCAAQKAITACRVTVVVTPCS